MNTLIQFFGGAALAVAAVSANAELSYSPNAVFDPDSGLYWRLFETVEQGEAAGFTWASVDQTKNLFLHYAPPDADGALPGYKPGWGGILTYKTSGDGMSYSFTWETDFLGVNDHLPPVLSDPFGHNIYYGNQPRGTYTDALLAWVASETAQPVLVLFRDATYTTPYDYGRGTVEGIIDPPSESINVCPPCTYYDEITGIGYPIDYYKDDGSLKTAGYLMVSSVPEPAHHLLFLAGIVSIVLRRKLREV